MRNTSGPGECAVPDSLQNGTSASPPTPSSSPGAVFEWEAGESDAGTDVRVDVAEWVSPRPRPPYAAACVRAGADASLTQTLRPSPGRFESSRPSRGGLWGVFAGEKKHSESSGARSSAQQPTVGDLKDETSSRVTN